MRCGTSISRGRCFQAHDADSSILYADPTIYEFVSQNAASFPSHSHELWSNHKHCLLICDYQITLTKSSIDSKFSACDAAIDLQSLPCPRSDALLYRNLSISHLLALYISVGALLEREDPKHTIRLRHGSVYIQLHYERRSLYSLVFPGKRPPNSMGYAKNGEQNQTTWVDRELATLKQVS